MLLYVLTMIDGEDYMMPIVRVCSTPEVRDDMELKFLRYVYGGSQFLEDDEGNQVDADECDLEHLRAQFESDRQWSGTPGDWSYELSIVKLDDPFLGL